MLRESMLRDPNLVPLSHQHQHALALCVRIRRALDSGATNYDNLQQEIVQLWNSEIAAHFEAEEQFIFPPANDIGLAPLVERLLAHHALITARVLQARRKEMSLDDISRFAAELSEHIRIEERELFEELQKRLTPDQLRILNENVATIIGDSGGACSLTSDVSLPDLPE